MTNLAHRWLGLDEIWWLVTPQNPLKSNQGMASLEDRLDCARQIARRQNHIKVIAPERGLGDYHTYKTLVYLGKVAPHMRFVWVMGADNLVQFPKWKRHRDIVQCMPIAVIDRPSYSYRAISVGQFVLARRKPARRLGKSVRQGRTKSPAWCFIAGRRHHASATALRARASRHTSSALDPYRA